MLKIRMSRGGAKKRPVYKIVIADSRKPRDGRFIEKVGFFNPLLPKDKKERLNLDVDRIKYWLEKGAKPSDRIARFLGEANIIPKSVQRNNPNKAKPKKKAQERLAAAEEAKKAAEESVKAEAEKPAEEAAKAEVEKPAEPTPAPANEAPAEETKSEEEEKPAEEPVKEEEKK
jgi:small subunit ribosomal protein S16|tara:strand:- start:1007 stop:1525 length:519 start_codon:yes stop_codon:yes gene_type:complete